MLRLFRTPALALLACVVPQLAFAHALLVSSTPAANAVVHGPSLHVDLRFNPRIDAQRCALSLAGADGVKQLTIEQASQADELAADAEGLHRGSYELRWQALSVDGHITRGEIPFRVE